MAKCNGEIVRTHLELEGTLTENHLSFRQEGPLLPNGEKGTLGKHGFAKFGLKFLFKDWIYKVDWEGYKITFKGPKGDELVALIIDHEFKDGW